MRGLPLVDDDVENGDRNPASRAGARGERGGLPLRRQVRGKQVRRELVPHQSKALLKELHLLTREGNLNADSLRKLKQVNHLVTLIEPAMADVWERHPEPSLLDAASGKGYLGFVLYELFFKPSDRGRLFMVESREALQREAAERALRLGYDRMTFVTSLLEQAELPQRIHLVFALHACDTATDDVLVRAIRHGADHVAVVPCCQAEVASQLKEARPRVAQSWESLFSHPWHRREFGSHLTNVIRALMLEAFGYQVSVTELVGWEHSVKNELILARKVHRESSEARARLDKLLFETQVRPKLVRELLGQPV